MKNIVLIGMPGSGKSTVGVVLAKQLGYNFVDTDILIAHSMGAPLPQLIEKLGYRGLIEVEGKIGEELNCNRTVIATGGSMVFSGGAMDNLRKNGVVVWIKVGKGELESRLSDGLESRGVAAPKGTTLDELIEQRRPYYEKFADLIVESKPGVDETAAQIRAALAKAELNHRA